VGELNKREFRYPSKISIGLSGYWQGQGKAQNYYPNISHDDAGAFSFTGWRVSEG
jgi:hypothetical protein